jgi:gluconate 2-dehydrogenase gamma chain
MGYINTIAPYNFPILDGKQFLNEIELSQVRRLFDVLFPPDHKNGVPGASDANAEFFLSYLLALEDTEYYKITSWRKTYRQGLTSLENCAIQKFEKGILELSNEQVIGLLTDLENNQLLEFHLDIKQSDFFKLLLNHCIQGCFSDPRWGGNKNEIMWRWLGWINPITDIKFNS